MQSDYETYGSLTFLKMPIVFIHVSGKIFQGLIDAHSSVVHAVTCSFSISCLRQSPVVSRGQTHQQQFHDKRFDLLSDLGEDIFAAPPNMNAGASSGFANFAHFNSHTSKKKTKKYLQVRTH